MTVWATSILAKGDVAAARKSWEDALRHAPMTNPLVGVIETN